MEHNPYAPPTTEVEGGSDASRAAPMVGPSGLTGWLVLVCLGLIATPIRLTFYLVKTFPPIFSSGAWKRVTTPGSGYYHPLWGPLLIGEIVVNSAFIAATIYLLVSFFRKVRSFPRDYVIFLVSNLLFILADAVIVRVILPDRPLISSESMGEFFRGLIGALIWVPYMFVSKRVKNTFVN